ncbi:MAG: carboxyl transferase domain-containing protein, partial [Planctomycetota bacterium]
MSAEPHPSRVASPPGPSARGEYDIALARLEREITRIEELQTQGGSDLALELCGVRDRLVTLAERAYSHLNGWQTVQIARHPARPVLPHYLEMIVRDFCELSGDRCFRDDRAVTVGFGRIAGHKVMVVGHNKGRDTHDRVARCFGHPHPEGFRKALRAMKLAEKFGLPVVSFIDTPGAYPGVGAEERGTAQAIAVNLMEMARLRVPIICAVIGEGGSGGALGIGVGDRIGVLSHSYYSVITPEGCAS